MPPTQQRTMCMYQPAAAFSVSNDFTIAAHGPAALPWYLTLGPHQSLLLESPQKGHYNHLGL